MQIETYKGVNSKLTSQKQIEWWKPDERTKDGRDRETHIEPDRQLQEGKKNKGDEYRREKRDSGKEERGSLSV